MALIKLGGIVTAISGKMGGTSFGTSASGAYAKNSGTPRKTITVKQRKAMALMGTTAQQWRELTSAQRNTFNAASPDYPYLNRIGETKFYSGYAIFAQLKNNGINVAFSGLPIPLPRITFASIAGSQVFVDAGNLKAQIVNSEIGKIYQVFVSGFKSNGVSSAYKNQFFVGQVAGTGGVASLTLTGGYIAKFGTIPSEGKLFYSFNAVDVSTGQSYKKLETGYWEL